MTDKQGRDPNDGFYNNIMKTIFNVYAKNKEIARQLIDKGTVVTTICCIAYRLLVFDNIIDPIDSTDRKEIAHYLLNII